MPVAFIADELKKLWDLKQAGALTEVEFAQQKARLLGEQTTIEANPEQSAIEASPEQPATESISEPSATEAISEQNIVEANPEQSESKLAAASVDLLDSQGQEVDASGPIYPPEPVSSPTPSPKVESRPLVKCPECGAPTFDLAHHRHLPFFIPERRYGIPAEDSKRIVTEEKENFGKNVADVSKAPHPLPTSIPVPEQIVAPRERGTKGGRLILKIVFWVIAFLGVLYIIAAIVSNSPAPTNPETKPVISSSSSHFGRHSLRYPLRSRIFSTASLLNLLKFGFTDHGPAFTQRHSFMFQIMWDNIVGEWQVNNISLCI